ncbi:MAG: PIN domain-containing protein [Oscillospiraceae bacterium]|nr:PIN domain-containing protein [Oscillospiraceae bacterium]
MRLLDANYLLRFIMHDNLEMAIEVRTAILSGTVHVQDAVLEEVVHVLKRVYKIDRTVIADAILKFTELENVETENQTVIETCMQYYSETSLDFVDCLLAAYHLHEGHEILTFDKKLKKLIARQDES